MNRANRVRCPSTKLCKCGQCSPWRAAGKPLQRAWFLWTHYGGMGSCCEILAPKSWGPMPPPARKGLMSSRTIYPFENETRLFWLQLLQMHAVAPRKKITRGHRQTSGAAPAQLPSGSDNGHAGTLVPRSRRSCRCRAGGGREKSSSSSVVPCRCLCWICR